MNIPLNFHWIPWISDDINVHLAHWIPWISHSTDMKSLVVRIENHIEICAASRFARINQGVEAEKLERTAPLRRTPTESARSEMAMERLPRSIAGIFHSSGQGLSVLSVCAGIVAFCFPNVTNGTVFFVFRNVSLLNLNTYLQQLRTLPDDPISKWPQLKSYGSYGTWPWK